MMNFTKEVIHEVLIPGGMIHLDGLLYIPQDAHGLVLFVHGSGSSRFSVRNQYVAEILNKAKLATLLFDLFTKDEDIIDTRTRELRFNINFLASRLELATEWCLQQPALNKLAMGYFGASTGGGAALVSAAKNAEIIKAVVSRGGRPDLAYDALPLVCAPTLLIVGGNDGEVIKLNQSALAQLTCIKKLEIVPAATHLFEEPGTLESVAELSSFWFSKYLGSGFSEET